jgi:hypothetical protein
MLANNEMKSCPNCGGKIKQQALKCKHCQTFLTFYGVELKQGIPDVVTGNVGSAETKEHDLGMGTPTDNVSSLRSSSSTAINAPTGLLVSAAISYFIAAIFIGIGFHKIIAYENPETGYEPLVNSYVGGDAYNYIINANYASAYFSLAVFCAVIGMTLIISYYLICLLQNIRKLDRG